MHHDHIDVRVSLLYSLGSVLDLARGEHAELVELRIEVAELREKYGEALELLIKQTDMGARNALLMGLAMAGEEGQKLAVKLIEGESRRGVNL